jgi:hypothetical protein
MAMPWSFWRAVAWLYPAAYLVLLVACIEVRRRRPSRAAVWLGIAATVLLLASCAEFAVMRLLGRAGMAAGPRVLLVSGGFQLVGLAARVSALVGAVLLIGEENRAKTADVAAEVAAERAGDTAPADRTGRGGVSGDAP